MKIIAEDENMTWATEGEDFEELGVGLWLMFLLVVSILAGL